MMQFTLNSRLWSNSNLLKILVYQPCLSTFCISLVRPPNVIGRNTQHAIQSGLLFGYVGLVQYMVECFRTELGSDMQVVGTGGLAETLSKETDIIDVVAPWLTLEGLRVVWSLNK